MWTVQESHSAWKSQVSCLAEAVLMWSILRRAKANTAELESRGQWKALMLGKGIYVKWRAWYFYLYPRVHYEQLFVFGFFFPISFSTGLVVNNILTTEFVREGYCCAFFGKTVECTVAFLFMSQTESHFKKYIRLYFALVKFSLFYINYIFANCSILKSNSKVSFFPSTVL